MPDGVGHRHPDRPAVGERVATLIKPALLEYLAVDQRSRPDLALNPPIALLKLEYQHPTFVLGFDVEVVQAEPVSAVIALRDVRQLLRNLVADRLRVGVLARQRRRQLGEL